MQQHKLNIIAVDDDELNLEILSKNLEDFGYNVICYEDGDDAWEFMEQHPENVDLALLDKMMPRMSGLEVLSRMKKHPILKKIPVIIQTGDVGVSAAKEGLSYGAYYYLTKPFDPSIMISLVNAAARDLIVNNKKLDKEKDERFLTELLYEGKFKIRTPAQASNLSAVLAAHTIDPEKFRVAFSELLYNAIEHGNLQIGYDKKKECLMNGTWAQELDAKLNAPENKARYVSVHVRVDDDVLKVKISDQGKGFSPEKFLEFDPSRLTDPNGRGIATAHHIGLHIEYVPPGNELVCTAKLKSA